MGILEGGAEDGDLRVSRTDLEPWCIVYDPTCTDCPEQANPWRQKVDLGHQGLGGGAWREKANGYEVSFWGDENFVELDDGDSCKTMNIKKESQ